MPLPKSYQPVTWQNINYQPQDFFNGAIQGSDIVYEQLSKERARKDQLLTNDDIAAMMRGEIKAPTSNRVDAEAFLRTKAFGDLTNSQLTTEELAQNAQRYTNQVAPDVHREAMETADAGQAQNLAGAAANNAQADQIREVIAGLKREADLVKRISSADNAIEDQRRRRYQVHYTEYMKTNPSAALTEAGQDAANNAAAAAAEIDINQEADSGNLQKMLGLSEDIFSNTGLGRSRVVGEMTKAKIEEAAQELNAKNAKAKQSWLEQAPNNFAVFRWNSETNSLDAGDPAEQKLNPGELRNVLAVATKGSRVEFDPAKLSEDKAKLLNDLAPYLSSSMARHLGEVIRDAHTENSKVFGGFGGGLSSDDFVDRLTQEILTMRGDTPALVAKLAGGESITTKPNERFDLLTGFNVKTTDTVPGAGGNTSAIVPVTPENAGVRAKDIIKSAEDVNSAYETYKNAGSRTDQVRLANLRRKIVSGKSHQFLPADNSGSGLEKREAALITFNSIIEGYKKKDEERAARKAQEDAMRTAIIAASK